MSATDIEGTFARQRLVAAYFRRRTEDATEAELAEIREAIELLANRAPSTGA